jgi:hypothetical protein
MVSNKSISNLFTYPKFAGAVNLTIEETEVSVDQVTRSWLEDSLMENFNDGIKKISPYRIRPWSQVFIVETTRSKSYFLKIPAAEFDKEAQISELIKRFYPDNTPTILARNETNGAFLMDTLDGDTLRAIVRKQFDQTTLEDGALGIGEFQKNAREFIVDFDKLDIPKWTPEKIVKDCVLLIQNSRFLMHSDLSSKSLTEFRSLFPSIQEKLNILNDYDQGLSIDHGDFQDNNIFISEGRMVFMDWADASISIPSFTIGTYCHSALLAHPQITDKTSFLHNTLTKYYFSLLKVKFSNFHHAHVSLVHFLYPMICILKVERLLRLEEKNTDKYASTIIDYWIGIVISFSEAYRDQSLRNEII